jgi:hypothetical protein
MHEHDNQHRRRRRGRSYPPNRAGPAAIVWWWCCAARARAWVNPAVGCYLSVMQPLGSLEPTLAAVVHVRMARASPLPS